MRFNIVVMIALSWCRKLLIVLFLATPTVHAQQPSIQIAVNNIDLDSLIHRVKQLTGEIQVNINGQNHTIQSRQHQKTGNELAYQFLKQELSNYGYIIDSFRFNATGKNLYAVKKGTLFPNQSVILGAHYDNLPLAIVAPGADDNASGCAAVLEAARVLKNSSFPYTLTFALWDEEEPGLLGSTAHVNRMAGKNEQLVGYINLDMIGWDGNNDSIVDVHVKNIHHSAHLKETMLQAEHDYQIGLNFHVVQPGTYNSDQKPFWDKGYSAIALNEQYQYDFNPHYHKVTDELQYFNLDYFLRCSKLALATAAELASNTIYDYGFFEWKEEINCYPNPIQEQLFVQLKAKEETIDTIELFDFAGRKLDAFNAQSTTSLIIDTKDWKVGTYFMRIKTNRSTYIKKVIKI